jgi:hypothetical protein
MAISAAHFDILKTLDARDITSRGVRLLEIGEANYYGDFPATDVSCKFTQASDSFDVAKEIYRRIFEPTEMVAIDADHTRPAALKEDLNYPLRRMLALRGVLENAFDVVYNHGTAEHVFNIAQVFRTMHDACAVNGLMIHESPFTGWVDHGFYCLQPTLFWDVATANGYKMEFVAVEHLASRSWFEVTSREQILEMRRTDRLPDNAMLYVVMRKLATGDFKIPMQGVYGGTVSKQAQSAWRQLR